MVISVDVTLTPAVDVSLPKTLFTAPSGFSANPGRGYDVAPDGRFLTPIKDKSKQVAPPTQIVLVQNWLDELKRLVPTN